MRLNIPHHRHRPSFTLFEFFILLHSPTFSSVTISSNDQVFQCITISIKSPPTILKSKSLLFGSSQTAHALNNNFPYSICAKKRACPNCHLERYLHLKDHPIQLSACVQINGSRVHLLVFSLTRLTPVWRTRRACQSRLILSDLIMSRRLEKDETDGVVAFFLAFGYHPVYVCK